MSDGVGGVSPFESGRLVAKQVADLVGVSLSLLDKWRRAKKGPPYIRLEGRIYYPKDDFYKWIEDNKGK